MLKHITQAIFDECHVNPQISHALFYNHGIVRGQQGLKFKN